MRQVIPPFHLVQKILGVQKAAGEIPYRLSTHCMRVERPEGDLLYHTLTGELLLLSHEEAALLGAFPGSVPPVLAELVPSRFLVPKGTDDMALADQTRQIVEGFWKSKTALTTYTIFTTTDCNARCFYCYEAGWKKSSMTEATALTTAEFIAAHCGGRLVRIHWFGGEPLVNTKAIDVITDYLRRQGVEFYSTMTSNGYLFDETLVQRAWDTWNLQDVQITLDGTEEVYNQRKAYINHQGSPYRRVLRNIGILLDVGVRVKVRLNMDVDNEQDLYTLTNELAKRFSGKSGFSILTAVISENKGIDPHSYTEGERLTYAEKLRAVRAYAERLGIAAWEPLKRGFAVNACLADNGSSTTVTPEGKLGRCASCKNGDIWGNVYSKEADEEVLRQWRERKPPEDACKACPVYPQCVRIKKCPDLLEHCSPIERFLRQDRLRRAVLGAYEDWKAAGQS